MLAGAALIIAGVALIATAPAYVQANRDIARFQARAARNRGRARWYQALTAFQARTTEGSWNLVVCRLIGVAVIVGGVIWMLH